MLPWYAVQVQASRESRVAGRLASDGVETYWPSTEVKLKKHVAKDAPQTTRRSLFPGYLFVRSTDRRLILAAPHVLRIVGFGEHPVEIPASQIESVRILETTPTVEPCAYFTEGMPIRVRSGALAGAEGYVLRTKKGSRLVVSVNMLCRAVSAEVDAESLEAIALPKAA
jgi:transcription antitermination factor NusG